MTCAKRYLVTGGLGYAGSWIARHLANQGHTVFILSRGHAPLPALDFSYTFIGADIHALAPEDLAALLPHDLDGCVHAAAAADSYIPDYPRISLMVNGYGTRNMADALLLHAQKQNRPPHMIYCSTFHVYGKENGIITGHTPPEPRNDYALTHLIGEEYCRLYAREYGLPCTIIRPSNGYGEPISRPFGKWHLLINDLCRAAHMTGSITLRSSPSVMRDFVWLGDVAEAVSRIFTLQDKTAGRTFTLASGSAMSLGDVCTVVATTASDFLGKDIPVRYEKPVSHAPHQGSPAVPLSISIDAAKECFNFSPTDMLVQEVRNTLEFLERFGAV